MGLGAVVSTPSAPTIASLVPTAAASDLAGIAQAVAVAPESVLRLASSLVEAPELPSPGTVRDALAAGDAMTARTTADAMLEFLRAQSAGLDADVVRRLATELCEVRADAIWALGAPPRGSQGAFLRRTVAGATLGDWQYGVPASVTLAQAILESDWGRSAPGHNLFGMKGKGPAGSTVRRVVEYRKGRRTTRLDPFRAYHSEAEALADHARLLGTRRVYAKARQAGEDRRKFAQALVGIYASDPTYARKLDTLIVLFRLDRFDWSASGAAAPEALGMGSVDPALGPLDSLWQVPAGWGWGPGGEGERGGGAGGAGRR